MMARTVELTAPSARASLRVHSMGAELITADGDVSALAEQLATELPAGTELMVRDPQQGDPRLRLAREAGATVRAEKVLAGRSLTDLPPLEDAGLVGRSLAYVGPEAFAAALLAAAEGDAFSETTPQTARADLDELIEYAGEAFDAAAWQILRDAQGDLGVVLPQRFADERHRGTLFYLGVFPPRRGQGWGRRLHLLGLHALRAAGAVEYVGSTDTRNPAMLAVFAANGCVETQRQVFLTRS